MSVELEEADLPLTEAEEAPLAPEKKGLSRKAKGAVGAALSPSKKRKNSRKKNQPGKYSQLVVETIRKLGERGGSSLAKVYKEAKKVGWFDQQNGRTYLKYSIKALVQNDTLLQVKGTGANGSFKLNKKKLEGGAAERAPAVPAAPSRASRAHPAKPHKKAAPPAPAASPRRAERKPASKGKKQPEKKSHKKGAAARRDKAGKAKKAAKKTSAAASAKKAKKAAKPRALKGRK